MAVAQEHGSEPAEVAAGWGRGRRWEGRYSRPAPPAPVRRPKRKRKKIKKAQRPPPHRHRRRRAPAGDSDAAMPDGDADVTGAEPLRTTEAAVGPGRRPPWLMDARGHYLLD